MEMDGNPSTEMPTPVLCNQADTTIVEYKVALPVFQMQPCACNFAISFSFNSPQFISLLQISLLMARLVKSVASLECLRDPSKSNGPLKVNMTKTELQVAMPLSSSHTSSQQCTQFCPFNCSGHKRVKEFFFFYFLTSQIFGLSRNTTGLI